MNNTGEWMSSWVKNNVSPPDDAKTNRYLPVKYIRDKSSIDAALIEVDREKEGVVCGICNENGTGLSTDTPAKKYVRAFHGEHDRATQFSQIPTTSVFRHDWYLLNENQITPQGNQWNEVSDVLPFGGAYSIELFQAYSRMLDVSFREYLNDKEWVILDADNVLTYGSRVNDVFNSVDMDVFDKMGNRSNRKTHSERKEQMKKQNTVNEVIGQWGERETATPGIDFQYAVDSAREIWCHRYNQLRILDQLLMEWLERIGETKKSVAYEKRIDEGNTPGTSKEMKKTYYEMIAGRKSNEEE